MGVSSQQHRVLTGVYNFSFKFMTSGSKKSADSNDFKGFFETLRVCIGVFGILLYLYILCLIMAMSINITNTGPWFRASSISDPIYSLSGNIRDFLNCSFIILLKFVPGYYFKRKRKTYFLHWITDKITLWAALMNLLLIIISNPSILNPGPGKNFSVMYQNVRGFVPFSSLGESHPPLNVNKILEFQSYVFRNEPDLIILNETWLSKSHVNNEILPCDAYKIFRLDRSMKSHPVDPSNPKKFKRNGGGILIAVKTGNDVESKLIKMKCGAEIMSVEIDFGSKNIFCVSTCYRVGTLGSLNRAEIERYLRTLAKTKKFKKHCLIGDFNLSSTTWPEGESTVEVEKGFLGLFSDLGLTQVIDSPTHEKGKILDLLLTNVPSLVNDVTILNQNEVCSSDHFGVTFSLGAVKRKKSPKRKMFNFKKADWANLNKDLKSVPWDKLLKFTDAQSAWIKFKGILLGLCQKHIPTVTVQYKFQPPWFDCDTHRLCREKERLRAKYKQTKSSADYSKFSQCRKKFKNLVQEKMSSNFEDESDPALVSKKFWSHLKSSSNTSRIPETVNYNGRFRNNPLDQCELFNTYFADQFSQASTYNIRVDFSTEPNDGFQITHQDVRKLLKNINSNKAPGPDGMHGKILKNCAEGICYPLSLIFKTSYNTGLIPNEWKLANVVPVFKKGSKTSVENYRPISLTCLVMKIFETLVRDELMLRCNHLLNDNQHGFLPLKSCTTQLIPFNDSLALSLNDATRTDIVYFDFAKAFDSVNHDIILDKLKYKFNIDGLMLKFIVNYLEDRNQCVVIGGSKSELKSVTSGVPQGSILGPLFFVLFINDMVECVSEGTSIALYADDTKIWRRITSWSDHLTLQRNIDSLFKWSVENKMTFHPHKCKVVSVTMQNSISYLELILPFQNFHYCLNMAQEENTLLDFVESEKDLGVIITNRLSWGQQSSALYSKANSRLGLLKRVCHFVNCEKQKRILYLAMVRSIFEHASVVWSSSSTQTQELEKIQKRGVKWILDEQGHSYNTLEYMKRLFDLKILPLETKFVFTDLLLFHKIFYGTTCINMPDYITPVLDEDLQRLRTTHLDELSLKSLITPRISAFQDSYFHRSYLKWNSLPFTIRAITDKAVFESELKEHLWSVLLTNQDSD